MMVRPSSRLRLPSFFSFPMLKLCSWACSPRGIFPDKVGIRTSGSRPAPEVLGLGLSERMFFVYFIESKADPDFVYIGVTENLSRRVGEHNSGKSRSTKPKKPFTLLYFEAYKTRSEARKREYYLKHDFGGVRLKKKIVETVRKSKGDCVQVSVGL